MPVSIDPFDNKPDNDADQGPSATTSSWQEAEIFHQGRDCQDEPTQSPPLTGAQMDEVGW
jgi:hypothetical protein